MKKYDSPLVSVIMPLFNCELYVNEAIGSILNQTFSDFELILIDDGSTDKTYSMILEIADSRVKVQRNSTNCGIVVSLNRGLELARGKYIARMDADDIALPQRLEKQVSLMEAKPLLGACGSWVIVIGEENGQIWRSPKLHEEIKAEMVFNSCLYHPTVMMRRSIIQKHKIMYNHDYPHAEDYELWTRLAKVAQLENICEPLLYYRRHSAQIGNRYNLEQTVSTNRIRSRQLRELGIVVDRAELDFHAEVARYKFEPNWDFLEKMDQWFERLNKGNISCEYSNKKSFEKVLGLRWYFACKTMSRFGFKAWRRFRISRFSRTGGLSLSEKIYFLLHCAFSSFTDTV